MLWLGSLSSRDGISAGSQAGERLKTRGGPRRNASSLAVLAVHLRGTSLHSWCESFDRFIGLPNRNIKLPRILTVLVQALEVP